MIYRLLQFAFLLLLASCNGSLCGLDGNCQGVPSFTSASSVPNDDGTVTVTITGSGFVNGMTITVNGTPCTNVNVLSSTQATCVLPNGQIALVNIIITTPDGGSGGSSLTSPLVSTTAAVASNVGGGDASWTNVNSAKTNDGTYASVSLNSGDNTDHIRLTGYFSLAAQALPSNVTIDGVKVSCYWAGRTIGDPNTLGSIYLALNNAAVGVNKANSEAIAAWGTSTNFGGATDTWGLALTPANINDATFGVQIKIDGATPMLGSSGTPKIDYCTLSVYFSD